MRLVLLHIQCPIYKLEKGGQWAHDIFRRGGALAFKDDGACDPLLFQKGGIFPTTNKTLRVIHITSYSILSVHQVFMLIEISTIQIGGYAIIKTGRKKNLHVKRWLHVTTHSHELISLESINCVNNIECYWSRSHSLSATPCLPRVLSDLFLGQCHQLPLLLPLGLHLFTLNRDCSRFNPFYWPFKHQDL